MELAFGRISAVVLDLEDPAQLAQLAHGITGASDRVFFFSDEWEQRRPQCEGFLRARAGLFERRVGARSCTVREVPRSQSDAFLDAAHVQGAGPMALVRFGLWEGDVLVGVLSLGRHHRQNAGNCAVLDRLCFAPGVQVVGGASRLFARAQEWARDRNYDEIVSFSDHRLTPGTVYERLGFVRQRTYRPDYFYVRDGNRVSKQSQRKGNTGCPADVTELTWAQAHGLVRCYDAGKTHWAFNLQPDVHLTCKEKNSARCAQRHAAGDFRHAHVRGHLPSAKNGGTVYYGSSFELRCLFELEQDGAVRAFRRCEAFQAADGRWRNPDLWVEFVDGHAEIWEVKPAALVETPDVLAQLADSLAYVLRKGARLRVWTERDSALGDEHRLVRWAHAYLADQQGDTAWTDRVKKQRKAIRDRHYKKEQAASVTVSCAYCGCEHTVLPRTYARNVARHDGTYVCEAMAGHIGGSKPKLALRKENPHAAEGKKECCRCHAILPIDAFEHRQKSRDGRSSACKPCISIANAARYQARKAHTSSC